MASVVVTGRADLTDAQWADLQPLLPTGKKRGRPPKWTKRQLIDGIRWRVRVGAPWRDVPPACGSWQAVYGLFRRWQRAGVWAAILARLQVRADARGHDPRERFLSLLGGQMHMVFQPPRYRPNA